MKRWIVANVLGALASLAFASDNYPSRPVKGGLARRDRLGRYLRALP